MPHTALIRRDIPDESLQITDLKPNNSQRNYIYDAEGETKYILRFPLPDTVALGQDPAGTFRTLVEYQGLAAYLLERIEDQAAGAALTAAQANGAATDILTRLTSGLALTAADINTEIQAQGGVDPGTTLTAGDSFGSVAEVLQILSGSTYTLPRDTIIEVGGAFVDNGGVARGSFSDAGGYLNNIDTGYFRLSWHEGQLSAFRDANYTYVGAQTAAVGPANGIGAAVVVYNDDGSLYTG